MLEQPACTPKLQKTGLEGVCSVEEMLHVCFASGLRRLRSLAGYSPGGKPGFRSVF